MLSHRTPAQSVPVGELLRRGTRGRERRSPILLWQNTQCKALVIRGCAQPVKTAISLPDEIFDPASRRANNPGMSRSEFFARAAGSHLDELDATSVTKQINAALAKIGDDEPNEWAVEAGRGVPAQGTDEWCSSAVELAGLTLADLSVADRRTGGPSWSFSPILPTRVDWRRYWLRR
jgi:hypothetical protein